MKIEKGTHNGYRTDLFMPILKTAEGKYIAVLSDDSPDRDDEIVSASCIRKMAADDNYLAGLLNHDNDILNLVCEWINKRVVEIEGHTALVAEPKFYKSNPKAKIIMGMLDEGAKPGISIGAIVKDYDEDEIGRRRFQELETVDGSFVGIPSNRHGRAMAVAKSYNFKESSKKQEGNQMEKEYTQKDVDSAVQKKVDEMKIDSDKQMATKDAEVADLKKKIEDSGKEVTEAKKSVEDLTSSLDESKAELEKTKKAALEKQKFADQGGEPNEANIDVEKEFSAGKLPIMRG